ncbi:uncharacterized protein YgiB involved in biofilm formation [Sphingobium sp. JAI105]|uniref:hypothetical protein n=1 Tax=Sphingobium sp. JAI105 TaxID=2787715 RepID=UPI0018CA9E0E|nr:hypothetical protein [Sphingobium sp. JAI105]MBG6116778.1 uncharacterized protein YgiB involved in biofilm formation [Sphingobium sp. JAI105]
MVRYLLMLLACLLCIPLAACETAAQRCAQAANPAECIKVADAGGDVNDYLLYGMAGYMLSSAMNGGQRQTVIVPDPHYRGYRRPIPSYQASRDYVRSRTVTTTTTKRGLFGGTKTTTSTARYSYRPSSFRSSFRRR